MKILFLGDSITDMGRHRDCDYNVFSYGMGYPFIATATLTSENPGKFDILNRGISGNRIVDLYARIKADVWNLKPDVLSILIGVNDVWHGLKEGEGNGVDLTRWEKVYRMLIEDTLKVLPNVKIMICEPFFLVGGATQDRLDEFVLVKEYAKVARKIAKDYNLAFVPLQEKLDEAAKASYAENYLYDGVHPAAAGAKLIADEWLKVFRAEVE